MNKNALHQKHICGLGHRLREMNYKEIIILFCLWSILDFTSTAANDDCGCTIWSDWSAYGVCSKQCDGGLQHRIRIRGCPEKEALDEDDSEKCSRHDIQWRDCNTRDCGCNDVCLEWSPWTRGQCSKACGGGELIKSRERYCKGGSHGLICPAKETLVENCNSQDCAGCQCGSWSDWSQYSQCSTSCGDGVQNRFKTRTCTSNVENVTCKEASKMTFLVACNLRPCCDEVCDEWSNWRTLEQCPTSCGDGVQRMIRNRICIIPSCLKEETKTDICPNKPCTGCDEVCDEWSNWRTLEQCPTSCGDGVKRMIRNRICITSSCIKEETKTEICPRKPCAVTDCESACNQWSSWDGGQCSKDCGTGERKRTRDRICPDSIGSLCPTKDSVVEQCNTQECSRGCQCGSWSQWSELSQCSQSCGDGIQTRVKTRMCASSDAQDQSCTEDKRSTDVSTCNTGPCPNANGCAHGEYLPHPDCTKFYRCVWGQKKEQQCGPGTGWHQSTKTCDYLNKVGCVPPNNVQTKVNTIG